MAIRLTGISTPIGGVTWEYSENKKQEVLKPVIPNRKINVFISSICGRPRYDDVRAKLKKAIESTQLADVYTFEAEGASSLPAGVHYKFALKDSDICIFLIDNKDGITSGVQDEIDIVKRYKIKALYYFCDEYSEEKTALEQSLIGSTFAKSTTVHKFEDLSKDGAQELINDIVKIYHYYCRKFFLGGYSESNDNNEFQSMNIIDADKISELTISKAVLNNIDKCKDYILKFIGGVSYGGLNEKAEKTSEIDEWGIQFLPVLFEGKSIKQFNTAMYLEVLKSQQTGNYHRIVQIRWQAIQAYFLDDIEKCIKYLENALEVAREKQQPMWVIKDILIDLRNQHFILDAMNNRYSESEAQCELMNSNETLYYPILDRIYDSLHEKYIEGLYKKKIESPYTSVFFSNLAQYGELLASSYIVSIYNGSLTHILLFYEKIKEFLFFLSSRYDNWIFKRDMLKMAIYTGKEKEIKGIQDTYPEILNNLGEKDALTIMEFCNNHPVRYKRVNSQLLAFGTIGYYLSNQYFKKYKKVIMNEIKDWLDDKQAIVVVGKNIFSCLSGVSLRLSQNILAKICCMFIDKHLVHWYIDMFKFIGSNINLCQMSEKIAVELIEHLVLVLENEKEREQIQYEPNFLYMLRKQNQILTEKLDKKIAEYFPIYYNGDYKLETTKNEAQDFPKFIENFVQSIQRSNKEQGQNGIYFAHGTSDIATIRSILCEKKFKCESSIMDAVISTTAYTLLESKEGVREKLDAVSLLICIVIKYTEDYKRNYDVYEKLMRQREKIEAIEQSVVLFNINSISLKIALQFLFISMNIDTYSNILELMSYIQNDIATIVYVERIIVEYLELDDNIVFPNKIEAIVLQNVFQWVHSDNLDVRWYANKILFGMLRNPENEGIINHQLLNIVDSDNAYIKNLILRNIYKTKGIFDSTKEYIISKCQNDANFVVRMVCKEENRKNAEK